MIYSYGTEEVAIFGQFLFFLSFLSQQIQNDWKPFASVTQKFPWESQRTKRYVVFHETQIFAYLPIYNRKDDFTQK